MKRSFLTCGIVLAATMATAAFAADQGPPPGAPPGPPSGASMKNMMGPVGAIQKVKDNIYMIPGGGGNTTVFVTKKGVVLVDVKLPGNGKDLMDQVRKVTDKPVIYVINTHSHFDHSGGDPYFPESVDIVAQVNCAKQIAAEDASKGETGKRGLVKTTYTHHMTLLSGDDAIDLYNFGPAHTSGDTLVVFPHEGVMSSGDVFASKGQPLIDTRNGGSGLNFGKFIGEAAHTIKGVTIVIPGHAPVATWQDFVDAGEFNRMMLEHARASLKAGKTAEEAMQSFHLPAKFKDYKLGPNMLQRSPAGNFATMYEELQAK